MKRQANTTITRPKLEYASCAWSPHTAKGKKQLESVQNAAACFCTSDYCKRQSVSGMVTDLGWDTLATRRLLQDVTLFYKIQFNLVNIIFPAVIQPYRLSSTRANHPLKKQVISATINPHKYSYFVRTVCVWNYIAGLCCECSHCECIPGSCTPRPMCLLNTCMLVFIQHSVHTTSTNILWSPSSVDDSLPAVTVSEY